jgi:hypothetical protein
VRARAPRSRRAQEDLVKKFHKQKWGQARQDAVPVPIFVSGSQSLGASQDQRPCLDLGEQIAALRKRVRQIEVDYYKDFEDDKALEG